MNADNARMGDPASPDHLGEPTAVLPETAAGLVELEKAQRAAAEAEERAKSHWDQYLRAVAELENYRKRAVRDIESAGRQAVERIVHELLPVKDSLSLAVDNAPRADARSLAEGQEATLRLLDKAFEKLGIQEINPAPGVAFDPTRHEAVMARESPDVAPDAVLQVVQRGYVLAERLLRPARVIVAKA